MMNQVEVPSAYSEVLLTRDMYAVSEYELAMKWLIPMLCEVRKALDLRETDELVCLRVFAQAASPDMIERATNPAQAG